MKKFHIAYGSNLNLGQMEIRCPDAKPYAVTQLDGWRLLFRGSKTGSYLTIEPTDGYTVPIAVWEVSESDEDALDRYEGYPDFYFKENMEFTIEGEKVEAFVYIMHPGRPSGIPSRRYMVTCIEGYISFGFDTDILKKAYFESKEEMICHSELN